MQFRRLIIRITVAVIGIVVLMLGTWVFRRVPIPTVSTSAISVPSDIPRRPATGSEPAPLCQGFYTAICVKRGETRDPTGSVRPDFEGEVDALHLFQDLVRNHPDWSGDEVDSELANQIYTPPRRQRIESAYRWVQRGIQRFITRQPDTVLSPFEKHRLRERIRNTKLELPPPATVYDDEPDLFTKSDVYYERAADGKMRMRVGGAFLITVKSWFNMVFTVAHELAHAIDPCEMRAAGIKLGAYERLTACFLREGIVAPRSATEECGQHDQLSEAFADWVAAHITAEALHQFAIEFPGPQLANATTNAVRDLCEQDDGDEVEVDLHPKPQIRINTLFGQNPAIREVLGCAPPPPEHPYCEFDTETETPNPPHSHEEVPHAPAPPAGTKNL